MSWSRAHTAREPWNHLDQLGLPSKALCQVSKRQSAATPEPMQGSGPSPCTTPSALQGCPAVWPGGHAAPPATISGNLHHVQCAQTLCACRSGLSRHPA